MGYLNFQIFIQVTLSVISVITTFILVRFINASIIKYGNKQNFLEKRVVYIRKVASLIVYLLMGMCLAITWGIDFRGVFIFASSFFAMVGIALFASWSILSNITSSFLLFFSFPYKIGDQIKILDADNTITGKLVDITLFNLQIEDNQGNTVVFPNNLAIQKAIVKYTANT